MFERIDFYRWRCVRTVIDVVEQVPGRWLSRPPMLLNESSVSLLLLWSWLRWENDFLTLCLKDLGVDLASLANQVDALLKEHAIPQDSPARAHWTPGNPHAVAILRELTASWLNRAAAEARSLRQGFLGVEHLLLAFLREEGSPIVLLFSLFGIDHRRLAAAILEAIERRQSSKDEPVEVAAFDAYSTEGLQKRPPTPAVGMPKRFSMAIMMAWVTLFAIVFSVLKGMDSKMPPEIFALTGVLMFCVGIGQMWLFGGNAPRAASIWTGAVALSVEVFILNIATGFFCSRDAGIGQRISESIGEVILCIPLGAFFGYLAGGLTAGIVLILNRLEKKNDSEETAEEQNATGEAETVEE
jgi:hypothetical protein